MLEMGIARRITVQSDRSTLKFINEVFCGWECSQLHHFSVPISSNRVLRVWKCRKSDERFVLYYSGKVPAFFSSIRSMGFSLFGARTNCNNKRYLLLKWWEMTSALNFSPSIKFGQDSWIIYIIYTSEFQLD